MLLLISLALMACQPTMPRSTPVLPIATTILYAGAEWLLAIIKLTIDAEADTKLINRFGGTALTPASVRDSWIGKKP